MGVIYYRSVINRQIKDDRKLICNVKGFPAIYDTYHPSYKDRSERKIIWETVAQNLQSSAKMCEERWEILVDMYKTTDNGSDLHRDLYEMMDQFLNEFLGSVDLPADDFEEQIDFDQMLTFGLIDRACASLPSDIRPCANDDKPEVCSEYPESFYETENVEFYSV